ncbi:SulP family inorganic anion transporter [Deefgea rivuli]|uniref:SulP family inorganic anion transporter n=1 Tax=Deefgea rivuli TaxID=400948 RepID=UPI0006856953|nr:SulP family inorganic anion transporter [Deefgea rivuli]
MLTTCWRKLRSNSWQASIRADLLAALSVAVLSVPAVIAYAELIGLPAHAGLLAAIAGMLAYGLMGASKQVIVGPDAAIALLIAGGIAPLSGGNVLEALALAALLAILVGFVMMAAAWARLGVLAEFLSKPVLIGFLQGASVILIGTQIGKLFGISLSEPSFLPRMAQLLSQLSHTHWLTLALGLIFLVLYALLNRLRPRWPVTVILFAAVILADVLFDFQRFGISMVGAPSSEALVPHWPAFSFTALAALLPTAVGITMLAMPEGILLARAFAQRHGDQVDANREIMALGVANIAAGFAGGFAIGASQSRTTINDASGAQSAAAGLFAGIILLFFLFVLSDLLDHLPVVIVAALLIRAGSQLIDLPAFRELWRLDALAAGLAIATACGVVVVGVLPGILLGILLSLLHLIRMFSNPADAILRQTKDGYHDVGTDQKGLDDYTHDGVLVYRFYAPLIFVNASFFVMRIRGLLQDCPNLKCIIIDAQAIVKLDVSAAEQLQALIGELELQNIRMKWARCNRPLRDDLTRFGITAVLGDGAIYAHLDDAVAAFHWQSVAHLATEIPPYTLKKNV